MADKEAILKTHVGPYSVRPPQYYTVAVLSAMDEYAAELKKENDELKFRNDTVHKTNTDFYNKNIELQSTIEEKDKRITELENGIKNFTEWLKEKRPSMTGNGAPILVLQNLIEGIEFNWLKNSIEYLTEKLEEKDKQLNYWKERCEAAEEHITVLCNYPKGKITTEAWKNWQSLKEKQPGK